MCSLHVLILAEKKLKSQLVAILASPLKKGKQMSPKFQILFVTLLHVHLIRGSDPDPIQDFCIPSREESATTIQCKNSSLVTVEDFVFSGIKFPGKFSQTGLSATSVNANIFPGLNTLGMSFVRADFQVNGINVPHLHPRATEVAFVVEGRVYSGFVDTQNKVFARVLDKGEVMVFPRGLVHFQMNVGDRPATILGSFNSQNPGLLRIPSAIFGSGIRDDLLEKAFGLSSEDMAKLKRRFAPPT